MIQPIFISTLISAASVVAFKQCRKEAKAQSLLRIRRLDPS